jgi:4-amino-4-deoxy-L-arabinose transferase-like glycosyltransferase
MTALSVYFGGKLSLGGFFGLVMGGWLVKLVVFMAIVAVLKNAVFINGPVLFFTLVASILGTLAIDAISVTRSRIPTFTN